MLIGIYSKTSTVFAPGFVRAHSHGELVACQRHPRSVLAIELEGN